MSYLEPQRKRDKKKAKKEVKEEVSEPDDKSQSEKCNFIYYSIQLFALSH